MNNQSQAQQKSSFSLFKIAKTILPVVAAQFESPRNEDKKPQQQQTQQQVQQRYLPVHWQHQLTQHEKIQQKKASEYQKKRSLLYFEDEEAYYREMKMPQVQYQPDFIVDEYYLQKEQRKPRINNFPPQISNTMVYEQEKEKAVDIESLIEAATQYSTKSVQRGEIVDEILKIEVDKIKFQSELKQREEYKENTQQAIAELQLHYQEVDLLKNNPLRMSSSLSFFELQPHLIYQKDNFPRKIPSNNDIVAQDNVLGGFLSGLNLTYLHTEYKILFWNLKLQKHRILDTQHRILHISTIIHKLQVLLVILTEQKILTYRYQLGSDTFELQNFSEETTNGIQYTHLFQSKKTSRIFIGGQQGKVIEIQINDNNQISYLKSLIQINPKKMKKIDQNQSILNTLIGKIFDNPYSRNLVVVSIAEHRKTNTLFVAIQNQNEPEKTEIQVYSQGILGNKLEKGFKIKISEILEKLNTSGHLLSHVEISKLLVENDELLIVLNNGQLIFMKLHIEELDLIDYMQENQIPKQQQEFLCKYRIKPVFDITQIITIPFDLIISRYQSLFDDNNIPDDDIQEYYGWKPLISTPFNIAYSNKGDFNEHFRIIDIKSHNDNYIILIEQQQELESMYYILYLTPNYRRGTYNKYTQWLISAKQIQGASYQIQLEEKDKQLQIQVLTDEELRIYSIPSNTETLASYLKCQEAFTNTKYEGYINEEIKAYIDGQNRIETLKCLLEIILSNKFKDNFFHTNMVEPYYRNYTALVLENKYNYSYQESLKLLIESVNNYIHKEKLEPLRITDDMKQAALNLFNELTSSSKDIQVEQEIINFRAYQEALNSFKIEGGPLFNQIFHEFQVLEQLRMFTIQAHLQTIMKNIREKTLFRVRGNFITQDINIDYLESILDRLQHLKSFIQDNQAKLKLIDLEIHITDGNELNIGKNLQFLLILLDKFINGILLLKTIYLNNVWRTLTKKDFTRTQLDSFNLSLYEYLFEGISNSKVCTLIETYITNLDLKILHNSQIEEFRNIVSKFLPYEAISLFIGKKYLDHAYYLKVVAKNFDKTEFTKYCKDGFNQFLLFPSIINLPRALESLMKNDMIINAVILCLKRIEELQLLQQLWLNDKPDCKQKIKENEQLVHESIQIVLQILEQIILRINSAKEKKEFEKVQSEYNGIKILNQFLSTENDIQWLKGIKNSLVKISLKSSSSLFHFALYEFLIKYNSFQDFVNIPTPFSKEFLAQFNQQISESVSKKLQEGELGLQSMAQSISLNKCKIEATFKHFQSLKQYDACFVYLKDQITNPDLLLDIDDRVKWMNIAEGCYLKYEEAMQNIRQGKEGVLTENVSISKDEVANFKQFKDYFMVVQQLRTLIRDKGGLFPDSQNEKQNYMVFDEKMSFEIPDINLAYQVALDQKQWLLFVQLIEINELRNKNMTKAQIKETQDRIDFMYHELIREYAQEHLPRGDFKDTMNLLIKFLDMKNSNMYQVDIFPIELIINLIEQENLKIISDRNDTDFINHEVDLKNDNVFHPMWHIEFFINYYKKYSQLFDILLSIKGIFNQRQQTQQSNSPEEFFSIAYLILKWSKVDTGKNMEFKIVKGDIQRVKELMKLSIYNEMLFSAKYVDEVKRLINRIDTAIINI